MKISRYHRWIHFLSFSFFGCSSIRFDYQNGQMFSHFLVIVWYFFIYLKEVLLVFDWCFPRKIHRCYCSLVVWRSPVRWPDLDSFFLGLCFGRLSVLLAYFFWEWRIYLFGLPISFCSWTSLCFLVVCFYSWRWKDAACFLFSKTIDVLSFRVFRFRFHLRWARLR